MRLVFIGIVTAISLAGCGQSWKSSFQEACIKEVKSSLKSPSTFTLVEFDAWVTDEDGKPNGVLAMMEYDAVNTFNAPVRGKASCSYDTEVGAPTPKAFPKVQVLNL